MIEPERIEQQVFGRLSREDQLKTLHSMIAYVRSEQANDKRIILGLQEQVTTLNSTIKYLEGELEGIGMRRTEDTTTTSQKIQVAFSNQFAFLIWYRDKVLPSTVAAIQTIILTAILWLAFGGKVP